MSPVHLRHLVERALEKIHSWDIAAPPSPEFLIGFLISWISEDPDRADAFIERVSICEHVRNGLALDGQS